MLTDHEIQDAINTKDIVIDPFDKDRILPSTYRILLGTKLLIPRQGIKVTSSSTETEMYDSLDISNELYILKPKEFILAETYEKIGLSKSISAILDGKSTLARLGIGVHQTAQLIVPGQKAQIITLEIFNAGVFEVELTYKMQIGKLIFFKSNTPNDRGLDDYGIYIGQNETTGAIMDKN